MAKAFPMGIKHDARLIQMAAEQDRFLVEVRVITGWSRESAARLDRRLNRLAERSLHWTHRGFRQEWRFRFLQGWGSPWIRRAIAMERLRQGVPHPLDVKRIADSMARSIAREQQC